MDDFPTRRALALRILTTGENLTRKAGSFLGEVAVDPSPLSEKQADWFVKLAAKIGVDLEVQ